LLRPEGSGKALNLGGEVRFVVLGNCLRKLLLFPFRWRSAMQHLEAAFVGAGSLIGSEFEKDAITR